MLSSSQAAGKGRGALFGDSSADSSQAASPARASSDDERDARHHPYLSRRTMSITSLAAERALIDSMFDQAEEHHQPDAGPPAAMQRTDSHVTASPTPRSILMSQRLGQAHAGAVLPQMSPHTPALAAEPAAAMPPLALGAAAAPAAPAAPAEDEAAGRRLEAELRSLMRRVRVDDDDALAGTGESAAELRRIGAALTRCMALRDKYMELSGQHERANPKNQPGWTIYPPPPAPAWRDYREPAAEATT
ncbi:AMP deaminase, partial [Coemansia javaensis]